MYIINQNRNLDIRNKYDPLGKPQRTSKQGNVYIRGHRGPALHLLEGRCVRRNYF